ncbi:MAG: hypothetical protein VXZ96_16100 [Myxococcota bacterium]|nr:hypothetical protein [Myxococcota bacterium]
MNIALASCDNLPDWEVDDRPFHMALEQSGHKYTVISWTAQVDWSQYDAVLIRTTWDYTQKPKQFLQWAQNVSQVSHLLNPYPVLKWNLNKTYLAQLSNQGVSIAPSYWITKHNPVQLEPIFEDHNEQHWFLKPIVGACAESTLRFHRSEVASAQALIESKLDDGGMILQPYIKSVEQDGEFSLIFIDGQPSHAVQKIPVQGDYRVQDDFGASDYAIPVPKGLQALADTVWAALPFERKPLVARLDALNWNGTWVLNELELIEPSLFFRHGPNAANLLTNALERVIDNAKISNHRFA